MTSAALELLLWVRGASRNGSCALSPQPAAVTTRAARPAATPSRFLRSFITCPLGVPVGTQVYQCGISHRARGPCAVRVTTWRDGHAAAAVDLPALTVQLAGGRGRGFRGHRGAR